MAESCLDTWAFSAAFARENAALTRALQISLSDEKPSETLPLIPVEPEPEPEAEPDARPNRVPDRFSPTGRVGKRKARVGRRASTTYITADPENFREMVQRMTGVQFGEPSFPVQAAGRGRLNRVLEEEEQRRQWGLPSTLDTSSVHLVNRVEMGEPAGEVGPGFGLEPVVSFPTLESWGVF